MILSHESLPCRPPDTTDHAGMFTGIVEEVGSIVARSPRGAGARLTVRAKWRDYEIGESISVAGVCLTVDAIAGGGAFEADASPETLERSTLATARAGTRVNLERALRLTTRLGGHIVGGHVDATARLLARRACGEATQLRFELPAAVAHLVAPKGSIAVDGVSLTVNEVIEVDHASHATRANASEGRSFDVVVVPHTIRATTLEGLAVGALVNLEADVLARYVARLLQLDPSQRAAGPQQRAGASGASGASVAEDPLHDILRRAGYV